MFLEKPHVCMVSTVFFEKTFKSNQFYFNCAKLQYTLSQSTLNRRSKTKNYFLIINKPYSSHNEQGEKKLPQKICFIHDHVKETYHTTDNP